MSYLIAFPWASVTSSLRRLLAHSVELIRDCREASNTLPTRYREHQGRKTPFVANALDILVGFLSQNDPVLITYRD